MAKKKKLRAQFTYNGVRCDVTGKTQAELLSRIDAKKASIDNANSISRDMSVQSWITEYLDTYKRPRVGSSTFNDYQSILKHVNLTMSVKDVKPVHLQRILNANAGKSISFLRKLSQLIKDLFECAVDNELIQKNPARRLTLPDGTAGSHRAITDTERSLIELVAPTSSAGPYVALMLYAGLRPAEAGGVRGWDIDLDQMRLHVRGTKTASADRYVPISKALLPYLQNVPPEAFVVTNSRGGSTTKSSRRSLWQRFRRELNIAAGCSIGRPFKHSPHDQPLEDLIADDLVPYCLRHTFATDLEAAGVPINVARDLLGHADISVTSKIYTHRSEEAFRAAAEKINDFRANKFLEKNSLKKFP